VRLEIKGTPAVLNSMTVCAVHWLHTITA